MAVMVAGLPGCAGTYSTMEPAGPAAESVKLLWWIMLGGSAAILGLVMLLLWLAFRRTGERPVSQRRWILGGGLVFPMVVLTMLLGVAVWAGERLLPHERPDTVEIEAVASRWAWTFRPADGPETINILHIPAGRPVDMLISTEDVIHSFWVPRLAGKMDAIPGRVNRLRIEAREPGQYEGLCSEYCGWAHWQHRFSVVAHDAEGWATHMAAAQ